MDMKMNTDCSIEKFKKNLKCENQNKTNDNDINNIFNLFCDIITYWYQTNVPDLSIV